MVNHVTYFVSMVPIWDRRKTKSTNKVNTKIEVLLSNTNKIQMKQVLNVKIIFEFWLLGFFHCRDILSKVNFSSVTPLDFFCLGFSAYWKNHLSTHGKCKHGKPSKDNVIDYNCFHESLWHQLAFIKTWNL